MPKRDVRAAEYRRLEISARDLAQSSLLANVREKHEQAAAQWMALALLDERPVPPRLAPPRNAARLEPVSEDDGPAQGE